MRWEPLVYVLASRNGREVAGTENPRRRGSTLLSLSLKRRPPGADVPQCRWEGNPLSLPGGWDYRQALPAASSYQARSDAARNLAAGQRLLSSSGIVLNRRGNERGRVVERNPCKEGSFWQQTHHKKREPPIRVQPPPRVPDSSTTGRNAASFVPRIAHGKSPELNSGRWCPGGEPATSAPSLSVRTPHMRAVLCHRRASGLSYHRR